MRRLTLTLLPALLLGAAACETPLGPGTDGPLVFQARVGDHPWPQAGTAPTFTATLTSDQTFTIAAALRDSAMRPVELLGVSIPGFHGIGRYTLSGAPNAPWGLYQRRGSVGTTTYVTRAASGSTVSISAIDTVAHLAAGTFAFTGYRPGSDQSLPIADGTFRVRYTLTAPAPTAVEDGRQLSEARGVPAEVVGFRAAPGRP